MAKKKELTKEEKLQREKENGLSNIEREVPFLNSPSYFFNIGDKVSYGAIKESVVEDVLQRIITMVIHLIMKRIELHHG